MFREKATPDARTRVVEGGPEAQAGTQGGTTAQGPAWPVRSTTLPSTGNRSKRRIRRPNGRGVAISVRGPQVEHASLRQTVNPGEPLQILLLNG